MRDPFRTFRGFHNSIFPLGRFSFFRYRAVGIEPAIVADFTRSKYAEYQRYAANDVNPSIAADFNRDLYRSAV